MNVEEAIQQAKSYVKKVFSGESVSQIRLEEVEFDETHDAWLVTLGIMRPSANRLSLLEAYSPDVPLKRTYKVVKIANDGSGIPSIRIRDAGIDE